MEGYTLSAVRAAQAIAAGEMSSKELVQSCLDRIIACDEQVQAWAHIDPEYALVQATKADEHRTRGLSTGPLHGVPVGIKDIFDTHDFPTEDGTVLHAGRTPAKDATAVARLREAGAIIMGKTVTTELAVLSPGKTRNPHNPEYSPGGSSSGSAAATAAGQVPLALGTQTNGSVIRPAAYCGVVGYKPSYGLVSRHRVLQQSRPLDQIGVFARSVEDAALMAENIMGYDKNDPDTSPKARPNLLQVCLSDLPAEPMLGFVKTARWTNAEPAVHGGFDELVEALGSQIAEAELPGAFDNVYDWHSAIMEPDIALSFEREYEKSAGKISAVLRGIIERGQKTLAIDYRRARDQQTLLNLHLEALFEEFDAFITPATTGIAPHTLESTGSPEFCTPWTFCGMPAITLPLLQGENGMPIGVQLVGPRGDDARLLRTARWLSKKLGSEENNG